MSVGRLQIVVRGLTHRCPNCGGRGTLFQPGHPFRLNKECPNCGLVLERGEEGVFLGAMSLNYGVTIVCFLLPVLLLAWRGVIGERAAFALAASGALLVPLALYRSSRSWWLMNYYVVLPQQLPANGAGEAGPES